jgi:hypothetical protein
MRTVSRAIVFLALRCWAQEFHPEIPKAWDDKAVEGLEVPLAQRDRSPHYMSAKEYYALKVRPVYRSYPMYVKGREPAGYLDSLKQKDPEIIFDPAKLHTKEDWIAAGKLVFESDTQFFPVREPPAEGNTRGFPISKDGMLPGFISRYYVRKKGLLEVGGNSCAECHTRLMPDNSFLEGAQGSCCTPPQAAAIKAIVANPDELRRRVGRLWATSGAPWAMSRE